MPLVFFSLEISGEIPLEDVSRKLLGIGLLFERVRSQVSQVLFSQIKIVLLMGRRSVAELGVVSGNAKPLDQAERRKQLRLFEKDLRKNFLVEEIQAPRPEPDEVDEKNGENDEENQEKPADP